MNALRFCPPSILFLLFSLSFTIVLALVHVELFSMVIHLCVVFLWTFLLEYLCENKLIAMSWLLLVMPLVLIFLFLLAYMYLLKHSTPVIQN
jgi:hypothetical protein